MVRQWPPQHRLMGGLHGPGGFSIGPVGGSSTANTDPGFSLTAPAPVSWFSDPDVAQALFLIGLPAGVVATNRIVGRASLSPTVGGDGKFTSTLEQVDFAISAGDLVDFEIEDFAFAPFADGLTYVQFWVADAGLVQISAVSATISETIATAFNFLLEAGDDILLEAGNLILLEAA